MPNPRRGNGRNARQSARRRLREARARNVSRPLQQGVGRAVAKPFGDTGGPSIAQGFDAVSPVHLSLPRPVAPYTVVRTTVNISTADVVSLFGTFQNGQSDDNYWSNAVRLGSVVAGTAINGTTNTNVNHMTTLGQRGYAFMCCPAAMSVQIMNPEPLQTTSGIIYAGRSYSPGFLGGDTRTWNDFGNDFISFQSPRLMSAGKLALRGVKVDLMPMDMSDLASFMPVLESATSPITWSTAGFIPKGFSPMVIYNPNGVLLDFLVTIEWRVRFDPGSLAAGSHTYHKPASINTWTKAIEYGNSISHGVRDIAETVASGYQAFQALRGALAGPQQLALMVD